MSEPRKCAECGCDLPAEALAGLCPQCLLKVGLEAQSQFGTSSRVEGAPQSAGNSFVPPTPEELAKVIPHIEILELLAKGGMGAVYKGRQKSLDRLVAVKILPPGISGDSAFAERFTREARALGRLNHPNIVAVHDFGRTDGLFYFVMEYIDGANLRQLLKDKAFTPKEALAIVPQVCDALQFAHDEGIVHRDIKPENILIDKKGRVKVADFGLAKLLGRDHLDENLTATHQVMGTVRYMAPEQMEGAKDIDHRADIYSLGVVFYELLTGQLPLGRFAPPSKMVQVDVRLDEIVLRALEKEPKQRYQHAGEVKTEVETVVRTPHEAGTQAGAGKRTSAAPAGVIPFFKHIRSLGADLDEIERPYARWVTFPLLGFAAFCLVVFAATGLGSSHPPPGELFLTGLVCVAVAYLVLNVIWFARRALRRVDEHWVQPWTQEQAAQHLHRAARLLKITGILVLAGWFIMLPVFDRIGFAILWAVAAGTIICLGARRLAKNRDPGTVALILAMTPFSPAVVLGLPVGLSIMRMLSRPEIRELLKTKTEGQQTAEATV